MEVFGVVLLSSVSISFSNKSHNLEAETNVLDLKYEVDYGHFEIVQTLLRIKFVTLVNASPPLTYLSVSMEK